MQMANEGGVTTQDSGRSSRCFLEAELCFERGALAVKVEVVAGLAQRLIDALKSNHRPRMLQPGVLERGGTSPSVDETLTVGLPMNSCNVS